MLPFKLLLACAATQTFSRDVNMLTLIHHLTTVVMVAGLAQATPRGTIRTDTVWSGQIELQSNTIIAGATVRAEPGTVIRFAPSSGGTKNIALTLNGSPWASHEQARPARLILNGTVDRPILVETVEGATAGMIETVPGSAAALLARHVIFRRLGSPAGERTSKPAIAIELGGPDNDLWLRDCRFEQCGPLRAEFIGPDGSTEISRCRFSETAGAIALILSGPGTGIKVIQDNIADATFESSCPNLLIRDNVLVGENAALAVRNRLAEGISVIGNYVHCTWREDTGRYALRCEPATAILQGNVLAGGSYVIETAPRTVRRNVIIGVSNLQASFGMTGLAHDAPKITTTTHALVSNICADAEISENLLLGPAYSAIDITKGSKRIRIRKNVFDGWNSARRAIHFDITADDVSPVLLVDNVIAGYRQPPVHRESRGEEPLLTTGNNVFVGLAGPAFEGFSQRSDVAPDDRRVDALSIAGIPQPHAPATQAAADVDSLLMARRKNVADIHKTWFELYGRPQVSTE